MKEIFIRSYNTDGTFSIIKDIEYTSFVKAVNSGLQELKFRIARKLDEFNDDNEFDLNKKIELWVYDGDTGSEGAVVYSGYITEQNPIIEEAKEYVDIICLGYYSKLSADVLKDGSQTTLYTKATDGLTTTSGDISQATVSDVIRAIIKLYQENNDDSELSVLTIQDGGEDSVEETDNLMQVIFSGKTYQEAIEECKRYAPANWYWYIGEDNVFRLKQKANTADHIFRLGTDILSIKVEKNIQSISNVILVWGYDLDGGVTIAYKEYKDDTSISQYGRRVYQTTLYNVKDEETMDNLGNSILQENKDPTIKITLEIADNNDNSKGYDIESINPGDTCKIANLYEGDLFNNNMFITAVQWYPGKVVVSVDYKIQNLEKYLTILQRNVETQNLQGLPSIYS